MTTLRGLMLTSQRWYPYLGDAVAVRYAGVTLTGYASRSDHTLVEVAAPIPGLLVGHTVETAWRVGEEVHRCDGTVEALRPGGGFALRLTRTQLDEPSRRAHERLLLSVPVLLRTITDGPARVTAPCRSVDISNSGMKTSLTSTSLAVGARVALDIELGRSRDHLNAKVIWLDWQGFGRQIAGLRFDREIDPRGWLDHVHDAS